MKVRIESGELYPYYDFDKDGDEVIVPDAMAERWLRVMHEFEIVQNEMRLILCGE